MGKDSKGQAFKSSRCGMRIKPGLRLTSFFPASSSVSEFMGSSLLEYPLFSSEASTDKDVLFQPKEHTGEEVQGQRKEGKH